MTLRRYLLILFTAGAASLSACGGGEEEPIEYTEFEHFALRGDTTIPPGQYVLRGQAEVDALAPNFLQPAPAPNFSSQMVIGVSRGASRVCTSMKITRVVYEKDRVSVYAKETFRFTGSSCLSPSPLSSGTLGDFVVVPASEKSVAFFDEADA